MRAAMTPAASKMIGAGIQPTRPSMAAVKPPVPIKAAAAKLVSPTNPIWIVNPRQTVT